MNPPQYSEFSVDAQALLHSSNQDITIFVEDTHKHSSRFYHILFERIIPDVKITKIFHLGGRSKCIEKANHINETQSLQNKPFIAIIDGDFTWVRNEPPPEIKNLYQIKAYCIENLLIDAQPVTDVVKYHIALPKNELSNVFNYEDWLVEIRPLIKLFAFWAVKNKLLPDQCTTSTPLYNFKNQGKICPQKINNHCSDIENFDVDSFNNELAVVEANVSNLDNPIDIISGKNYLIYHLYEYIKPNLMSGNVQRDQIIINLAQQANVQRFDDLVNAIRQIIYSTPTSTP